MDTQTMINIALAIIYALGGGILKTLWDSIGELRKSDQALVEKMHAIETLVAGTYIKRIEFDRSIDALSNKLDIINTNISVRFDSLSSKLETKMDRGDCRELHGIVDRRANMP